MSNIKVGRKTTRPQKKCLGRCQRERSADKFYKYEGDEYADGMYPICKDCINNDLDAENLEQVKDQLMKLNRPFLPELWERSLVESVNRNMAPFGTYIKNVQLPKFRNLTWKDSEVSNKKITVADSLDSNIETKFEITSDIEFKVTPEMIKRWGANWTPENFISLETFYHEMKNMNDIEAPQDVAYLKKLAIISMRFDEAMVNEDFAKAKQLGDLFSKYMADSKFRKMDKTEADKTGGIRNFSTIWAEVEKDGVIDPWEKYRKIKNINQDLVDYTIMHIENFTLKLGGHEKMIDPPTDTPQIDEIDYHLYKDREKEIDIDEIEKQIQNELYGEGDL